MKLRMKAIIHAKMIKLEIFNFIQKLLILKLDCNYIITNIQQHSPEATFGNYRSAEKRYDFDLKKELTLVLTI